MRTLPCGQLHLRVKVLVPFNPEMPHSSGAKTHAKKITKKLMKVFCVTFKSNRYLSFRQSFCFVLVSLIMFAKPDISLHSCCLSSCARGFLMLRVSNYPWRWSGNSQSLQKIPCLCESVCGRRAVNTFCL